MSRARLDAQADETPGQGKDGGASERVFKQHAQYLVEHEPMRVLSAWESRRLQNNRRRLGSLEARTGPNFAFEDREAPLLLEIALVEVQQVRHVAGHLGGEIVEGVRLHPLSAVPEQI